jgi:hypothetical protein
MIMTTTPNLGRTEQSTRVSPMFSSKRISCLTGALLLGALPHAAAAQVTQSGAGEVAVKRSSPYGASSGRTIGVYGRSHALVIGINSYAGQWQPRSSAINDAQEVATTLKTLGFTVNQVLDPDRKQLSASFERFLRGPGSSPNSRLVIWFSGQAVTQDGKAHLLSMSRQGDRGLSDLGVNSVSLDEFSGHLRAAKATHVLSAFDACFSHSGFSMAFSAPSRALSQQTVEPVRQIITSCDANQIVSDSGKFRSLFLDALTGRAKVANLNSDDYLTGTELGLFLTDRLSSLTENLQTPTFGKLRYAGLDRGDMVFRIPSEPMTLPRPAAHTPATPQETREPEPRLAQKIQRRLIHLGCYSGRINGRWSRGTAGSIKRVSRKLRLSPPLISAHPDQSTLDRLRAITKRVCPVVARLPRKIKRVRPDRKSRRTKSWTAKPKPRRSTKSRRSRRKGKPASDPKSVFERLDEEGPG